MHTEMTEVNMLGLKESKRDWKSVAKKFLPIALLFILFSAFNGVLPITLCIFAAGSPMGTQTAMSVGYLAAIQLAFIQVGWTVSIACIYGFYKFYHCATNPQPTDLGNIYKLTNYVTLFYSIIFVPLYVVIGFIYNGIALAHVNTHVGLNQGYLFIFTSAIFSLFTGFVFNLVVYQAMLKKIWLASGMFLIYIAIVISSLVSGLAIYSAATNHDYVYYSLTMGCSLSIGAMLGLFVLFLISLKSLKITFAPLYGKMHTINIMFRHSYKNILIIVFIQVFKMIAIILIGYHYQYNTYSAISMNYMIGRDIWYNILYILPFIGYGLADAVLFYGIVDTKTPMNTIFKLGLYTSLSAILLQVLFAIGFYFAINPLVGIYLTNQNITEIIDKAAAEIAADPTKYKDQLNYLFKILLSKSEYVDKIKFLARNEAALRIYVGNLVGNDPIKTNIIVWIIKPIFEKISSGQLTPNEAAKQLTDLLTFADKINPQITVKVTDLLLNKLTTADQTAITHLFTFQYDYEDIANSDFAPNASANIIQKHSFAYLYLGLWTIFYSSGNILNSTKMTIKGSQRSLFEFIFIIVVEAVIIGLIVGIGLGFQYSTQFPVYDAWSIVLAVFGPFVYIYYLLTLLIQYKKWHKKIDKLNDTQIMSDVSLKK